MAAHNAAAQRHIRSNEEDEPRTSTSTAATAEALEEEILDLLPALRAYGLSLTKSPADADDLVQETLLKALANVHRFQRGTNLRAWLFTIERNTFYSEYRRRKREMPSEADPSDIIGSDGAQEWSVELDDVKGALAALPCDQRDAVVLVGGIGLSYEEAASICECPLGTIKSRVNRGRTGLQKILDRKSRPLPRD
ncbi:MAG: RNA polymerase subunit sigma [Parvibaculum sp.]|nr:RNA polymerase subunit sigma [Parvibaculum sp.]